MLNISNVSCEINYAADVEDAFNSKDFKFYKRDTKGGKLFVIPVPCKHNPTLHINLRIKETGDVKIWSFIANDINPDKNLEILTLVNYLNGRYRYVTFSIDNESDLSASYDFTLYGEDKEAIGEHVIAMVIVMAKVVDAVLPMIFKVLWRDENEESEISDSSFQTDT